MRPHRLQVGALIACAASIGVTACAAPGSSGHAQRDLNREAMAAIMFSHTFITPEQRADFQAAAERARAERAARTASASPGTPATSSGMAK